MSSSGLFFCIRRHGEVDQGKHDLIRFELRISIETDHSQAEQQRTIFQRIGFFTNFTASATLVANSLRLLPSNQNFLARSISREASFSFRVSRLSKVFFPLASDISSLASPRSFMNSFSGTMVIPPSLVFF